MSSNCCSGLMVKFRGVLAFHQSENCNNGLLIIVEKWYDNYQILITFIP